MALIFSKASTDELKGATTTLGSLNYMANNTQRRLGSVIDNLATFNKTNIERSIKSIKEDQSTNLFNMNQELDRLSKCLEEYRIP